MGRAIARRETLVLGTNSGAHSVFCDAVDVDTTFCIVMDEYQACARWRGNAYGVSGDTVYIEG